MAEEQIKTESKKVINFIGLLHYCQINKILPVILKKITFEQATFTGFRVLDAKPVMIEDIHIIEDCKKGKSTALDLIFKQYSGLMLGVCLRYCNNRGEAEDVLQEGFIKVFLNIGKFNYIGKGSFTGWIKRIMVNAALNHNRDSIKHWFHDDIDRIEDYFIQEENLVTKSECSLGEKEILEIVQGLPAGYKAVFNLFVFEKLGHKEIAEMLGVSENTSKSQLNKARKLLQKRINEHNSKVATMHDNGK